MIKVKYKNDFLYNSIVLSFSFYMITLFSFVDHPELFRYSQAAFLVFAGFAMIKILKDRKIHIGKAFAYYLVLPLIFLISYFWAFNKSAVINNSITVFQICILCILVYQVFYHETDMEMFIDIMLISGLFMCFYSLVLYGPKDIINNMIYGYRLGSEISQENTFGMNSAITAIICFYKGQKNKTLFYVLFLVCFVLAMSSGSKKALLMIILGVVALIFMKYGFKHFIKLLISMLIGFVLFYVAMSLPIFNVINERLNDFLFIFFGNGRIDGSTQLRKDFAILGYNLFLEKPFWGHGTGNYSFLNTIRPGYYSHNNFIELLVNNGLIGFVFYYSAYVYIINGLLKLSRKTDKVAGILLIIIVVSLITQVALVVYYDKLQYLYLTFGFLYIKNHTNNKMMRKSEVYNE